MAANTSQSKPGVNRQFVLAARPAGMPKESDFHLVESPVPALNDGEVLLHTVYLSVDPYMRGRISGVKSYAAPVEIGQVIVGGTVCEVVESKNPGFQKGDVVEAYTGWQEYAVSKGQGLRKLDPSLAPISTSVGVLCMPWVTAYFRLLSIFKPQPLRSRDCSD